MYREISLRSIVRTTLSTVILLTGFAAQAFAAGTISGRVTSSTTTNGLAGTVLQFYQFEADDFVANTTTDAMGFYTSPTLAAGTYAVLTQDINGYINEIWNNVQCSAVCDTNSITGIPITTAAVTGIDFVLDPGGRVSGTIIDSGTLNPIANVTVYFIDGAGEMFFSQATTDAMGHYIMDGGTATGNVYAVTANALGYRNEVYNDHYCVNCNVSAVGNHIPVTIGVTTGPIDFALDPGARITGTVTSSTPAPLAGVEVNIIDGSSHYVDNAITDAMGNYSTAGLPSGTYYAVTNNHLGYVDKLYNDKLCARGFCDPTQGTPIVVVSPGTASGINFVLPPGGTLTGTVTAAAGGAPLNNIFVGIFNSGGTFVGGAPTDDSGVYYTIVPTGTYYAAVMSAAGFANQLYNGKPCPGFCNVTTGDPIGVTAGLTTSNINFALTTGGSLTGTVRNASNLLPLGTLGVQLYSSSGGFLTSVNTDASGVYTFSGLSAASYYVRTNSTGQFINQLYNAAGNVTCIGCNVTSSGGSLISVTSGGATSGIDFNLAIGGRISGHITIFGTATPIQSIGAQIVTAANVSLTTFNTNASGDYITSGLPAGQYYVRTTNQLGYINKLYNDKPCTISCTATAGDAVTVTLNNTTPTIDFALVAGGRISGKVTNAATTSGISNASVLFYNSGGTIVGSLNTDSSGNYTTSGAPGGTYYARVQVSNSGYIGQAYNGKPCLQGDCSATMTTTDPIAVSVGMTTPNINFPLTLGGRFSGAISNADTLAAIASGVTVRIFDSGGTLVASAFPDGSGNYIPLTGLPIGTYYAKTTNSISFYDRLYDNKPCGVSCTVTTGTPISVTSGVTTPSVNFKLLPFFTYTDATITPQETMIKAVHLTELRTYINQLRKQLGIVPYSFTDTLTAGVTEVKVLHITELRTALDEVYDALGLTHYSYTDPVLTAGMLIRQVHIAEIRSAIQAVQ